MRKITKVILHNFKSHHHSEIPMSNFTAIIGPTNSGKSAIIAGINLALYNEPSGDKYITHGETECYVEVHFDDGKVIRRSREREGESKYELKESGSPEILALSNFGVGPVDEVVKFHGMPKVNIFGNEESLNIRRQMEAPFFLGESPQKKAKMIGKMAGTDVADLALFNINLEIRRKQEIAKRNRKEIKERTAKVKALEKVLPGLEKDLQEILKANEEIKSITEKSEKIKEISVQLETLRKKKEQLIRIISLESEVASVVSKAENAVFLSERAKMIESIKKKLEDARKDFSVKKRLIDIVGGEEEASIVLSAAESLKEKSVDLSEISKITDKRKEAILDMERKRKEMDIVSEADIADIVDEIEKINSKKSAVKGIERIKDLRNYEVSRKSKGEEVIKDLDSSYSLAFKKYKKALAEAKTCPLCMSEMSEDRIEKITEIV